MLTSEGAALMWAMATGVSSDSLQGRLCVTDGTQMAEALLDEPARVEGTLLVLVATFGHHEANFEWRERLVLSREGVVVDREAHDHGRKAEGSQWTLEATLLLQSATLLLQS